MSEQIFVYITDSIAHEYGCVCTQSTLPYLQQGAEPNLLTLLNIYICKEIKIKNATENSHKYKNLQDI